MKMKSTKRALLMSALSLVLCVSMLVGSTFAWFTDSVTSGKNIIQSGNLDVKLEYSIQENGVWTEYAEVTSTTDVFGYDNWEPGYTAIAKFRVTNAGSLALKYQLTADVYEEIPGVNVAGKEFLLSDYLYTEVVDADATREEILASTTGKRLKAPKRSDVPLTDLVVSARALEKGKSEEVALAIWMPTTVGNEANHNGTKQPSISFGINLIATQQTSEKDSFNDQYDVNAAYSALAWASKPVVDTGFVEMDLLRANGSKAGFASFPAAALDTAKENVTVKVVETKTNPTVVVEDDQTARTYEITAEGVKAGNDQPITVSLTVGTGLTGVKLYHHNVEVTDAVYDANDGTVKFTTTSFSPFTLVYDAVAVEEDESTLDTTVPKANVSDANEFENVELAWTGWGGFNPSSATQQLDSVYLFEAPHDSTTVQDCYYKDWGCDYFVMLESENLSVLPAGSITLGGNYGGYGWVGFDNPKVDTNTWIPLLGSVMGNGESGWTYADVVGLVKQFWCGVGVADGNTADLSDAKFVVELRLTNPEDPTDVKVANSVTYTLVPVEVDGQTDLNAAIASGASAVELADGNYNLMNGNDFSNKTVTISGTKDVIVDANTNVNNQFVTGADLVFDGVTINFGTDNYLGLANTASLTYKNCTINGYQYLYGDNITFENCVINSTGYAACVYDAKNVTFKKCEFNTAGKALLLYKDDLVSYVSNVKVEDCVFNASAPGYAGAITNQACAAVEIHNYGASYDLTTSGNTIDSDFSGEWRIKTFEASKGTTVTVNGVAYTQTALDGHLMTVTNQEATLA